MKRYLLIWIIILSTVFFSESKALPQEAMELTLDRSLQIALEKNPTYLAAKKQVDAARAEVGVVRSGFLPQVQARGMYTWKEKLMEIEIPPMFPGMEPIRTQLDFTLNYQLNVNVTQPLFTSGRLWYGYKQARSNLTFNREKLRQSQQEVVYQVKEAYYRCLMAEDFVKVAREAVGLAERHLKTVEDRRAVGLAINFDLLRAKVQLANLKPKLFQAENGRELSILALKNLLGLPLEQGIGLKDSLAFQPYDVDLKEATGKAERLRPELRQLEIQREIGHRMVNLARANYFPTLALVGDYNYRRKFFTFNLKDWSNYYTVNLVLSVPLFDGFSTYSRVNEARAGAAAVELGLEGLRDGIRLQVRQSYLSLQEAKESWISQEKNVEEAKESLRIAELSYAEGLVTSLDVIGAQLALTEAHTNQTQALYDYVLSIAKLEKAMGIGDD